MRYGQICLSSKFTQQQITVLRMQTEANCQRLQKSLLAESRIKDALKRLRAIEQLQPYRKKMT